MKLEVKVPAIGESINEVTIGTWLKKSGETVEEDEIIAEIESEKATVEITAGQAGILKILSAEGETVAVNSIIAEIDGNGSVPSQIKKDQPADDRTEIVENLTEPVSDDDKKVKISPLASKILKDARVSPDSVKGSGASGRIIKDDALNAVRSAQETPVPSRNLETKSESVAAPPVADPGKTDRKDRRERMSTLRKTISNRLLASKQGTAMLTTMNEIDMSAIMALRSKYKESFKEKYGIGLGFMSFFTTACAIALQEFPVINAMIDGDDIVYHDYCDISIAVSTPRGLVVPVIRSAEKMTMAQIEAEVLRLATKARDSKLTIDEMTGGTFSITNGGVFGSLLSTPIINSPQAAILGMHTIQERPVVRNGEIVIRPMMYVALSYDHRIIDGRESVSFLMRVREILEDPARMLLQL
ncbi:MAG: 2-oxoglutarate dehydrogenase complex dihydrolipoyllysine-residue succinyltransferase [Calditrichaceae bacterium]